MGRWRFLVSAASGFFSAALTASGTMSSRPLELAGGGVEAVEDAGGAEGVDLAVGEGGRGSRAGAAELFVEAGLVFVRPEFVAGVRRRSRRRLRLSPRCSCVKTRSATTVRDDQPGPMRRRQSCLGGDWSQSVSMRTPWTAPSELGPRKRGQSCGPAVEGLGVLRQALFGCCLSWSKRTRSARNWASPVGDHRQWKTGVFSPLRPSMRTRSLAIQAMIGMPNRPRRRKAGDERRVKNSHAVIAVMMMGVA